MPTQIKNARVTVMGLGRFGGGLGVTRWLAAQGARVTLTDTATEGELRASLDQLRDLLAQGAIRLRLGCHDTADFAGADLVIASPAVAKPWDNPYLKAAAGAGVPITTEIGLAVERLPERRMVIGVTGSMGKSTTSAMIHHALKAAGLPCVLGGNIGGSLLGLLEGLTPRTHVVLELSSFMLHWLHPWSPGLAIVTNLSPNHLDWHATLDHYRLSKQHLVDSQRPGDHALLGPTVAGWPLPEGVERVILDDRQGVAGLAIPGRHNAWNAAMAREAVRRAAPSLDPGAIEASLRTFAGLPHRLQLAAESAGIRYFNDSKATTPEAALLAVEAFADRLDRLHLIVGGYDKGSDLSPLGGLAPRLAGLYTIGATGPAIDAASSGRSLPCADLARAMSTLRTRAREGDIVLLSPGCASWDQFENYEERGAAFCRLAKDHA